MNKPSMPHQHKRIGAATMAVILLLQPVAPAFATVSQQPGIYTTPPAPNVMFTLDDSGSMLADALPDFSLPAPVTYTGVPADAASNYLQAVRGIWYPNMWGSGSAYLSIPLYQSTNAIARYMRSSAGNPLYYNPQVRYTPWPQAGNNALPMASANPLAVNIHTDDPTNSTYTVNLDTRQGAAGDETLGYWLATYYVYKDKNALPVAGTLAPLPPADPNGATMLNAAGNFDKYEIQDTGTTTYPRGPRRTDCTTSTTSCTRLEERQNFANWLQYYRNRRLMAKGGVATAFALQQGSGLRVGFARIGANPVIRRGVRTFLDVGVGTDRTDFFNLLYNEPSSNTGTPLRRAMDDVGQHFTTSDANSPWAQTPGASIGTEHGCRRSFHILSTDGYWNNGTGAAPTAAARTDNDNFSGSTPTRPDGTSGTYGDGAATPFGISPFQDLVADPTPGGGTLADVAAYYWKTDLRPTLANNATPSKSDPAFWQHLTTFTIGLGISGSGGVSVRNNASTPSGINFAAGATTVPATVPFGDPFYDYRGMPILSAPGVRDWLVASKIPLNWTTPVGDTATTGDDLIHAAMNGRGNYFPATNLPELVKGLSDALAEVVDNPGSLASVITESAQVSVNTEVYQATYSPANWYGRLYAFSQSGSGAVDTTPIKALWEASNRMPAPAARNIYTWNPSSNVGAPFKLLSDLTAAQRADLNNDQTLLDFLRGSDTNEIAQGGSFRDRSRYTAGIITVPGGPVSDVKKGGVLGDIVNGSPIKGPSAGGGFERLPTAVPGQATYAAYRSASSTSLDNLRDTIFAGANDGMLHAFDRNTGIERFAFVPSSVYSVRNPGAAPGSVLQKLKSLSTPGYAHKYTVDGPPQIGDAHIRNGGTAWGSVLVSSSGAGARSVFAMDVTNPKDATDTSPVVPGDYPRFDMNKLLWEFSEANNVDMGNVINYPHIARTVANVDGTGGEWVAIFGNGYDSLNGRAKLFVLNLRTGAVVAEIYAGTDTGNGLSQPNFVVNNKREVTAIYAGDLKGKLWKFDVSSPNPASWGVAFGGAPLWTGSDLQPITVMPEITFHPSGGTLVSFGTGKLFDNEDMWTTLPANVNLNTQAIYGIWDKPAETAGFMGNAALVQQTFTGAVGSDATANVTGTTSNAVDWTTQRGWYLNLSSGGERVHVNPQQAKSTLLVVANKFDVSDPCNNGGSSRVFGLDPITGGAPAFGVFNSNGDGVINNADLGFNVKAITSVVLSLPLLQTRKAGTDKVTSELAGSRGQTATRLGGVEDKPPGSKADCAQWLMAGGSNTTIPGFDIALCKANTPRISWRQLK